MKKLTSSVVFYITLFFFNSIALASPISISDGKTNYYPKQEIKVKFDVSSENVDTRKWWVGIYKESDSHETRSYETYQYLGDTSSGEVILEAPEKSGNYHLKLMNNDYVEKGTNRIPFVLATVDPNDVEMSTETPIIGPGNMIKVKVVTDSPSAETAWVGLFAASTPTSVTDYIDYQYLKGKKDGTYSFTAPESIGKYEFRYMTDDHGDEVKRLSFQAGYQKDITTGLELIKTEYEPNEPVVVKFKSHEEFPEKAWIGMFTKDSDQSHYLTWEYLRGALSGEISFIAPSNKGEYSLRLISSDRGQEMERVSFFVLNDLAAEPLKKELLSKGSISLYGIYFDVGKSDIKPESKPTLELIAKILHSSPDLQVEIQGHTDSRGSDTNNLTLSNHRALAVRNALIKEYSVPEAQLTSKGFGETSPKSSNDTASGRELNRRVELKKL